MVFAKNVRPLAPSVVDQFHLAQFVMAQTTLNLSLMELVTKTVQLISHLYHKTILASSVTMIVICATLKISLIALFAQSPRSVTRVVVLLTVQINGLLMKLVQHADSGLWQMLVQFLSLS